MTSTNDETSNTVSEEQPIFENPCITVLLEMGFSSEKINAAVTSCGGSDIATIDDLTTWLFANAESDDITHVVQESTSEFPPLDFEQLMQLGESEDDSLHTMDIPNNGSSAVDNSIFPVPLQYRETENDSSHLNGEPSCSGNTSTATRGMENVGLRERHSLHFPSVLEDENRRDSKRNRIQSYIHNSGSHFNGEPSCSGNTSTATRGMENVGLRERHSLHFPSVLEDENRRDSKRNRIQSFIHNSARSRNDSGRVSESDTLDTSWIPQELEFGGSGSPPHHSEMRSWIPQESGIGEEIGTASLALGLNVVVENIDIYPEVIAAVSAPPVLEGQVLMEEDPKDKRRHIFMYGGACVCVIAILSVAITIPIALKVWTATILPSPFPTIAPTIARSMTPTLNPTSNQFETLLHAVIPISGDIFSDHSSPQYKALEFMDDQNFNASNSNFVQRYVLAVFYYSMNGHTWISCGRFQTECRENLDNYLGHGDECSWYGNRCNDKGEIIFLNFGSSVGNGLRGTIPHELSRLTMLERLNLVNNKISGLIPTSLGSLAHLNTMHLDNNTLHGPIPNSLFNLTNLEHFTVYSNKFDGTVISRFSELTGLKSLILSSNKLTGTIPHEFALLTNLEQFSMYRNQLTGQIPTALLKIPTLRKVRLFTNLLTGTIPSTLSHNLTEFNITNNTMHGTIPEVFFNLSNFELIGLGMNNFSGSVSTEFGSLTNLKKLMLNSNRFTGTIPSELGNLELRELLLHDNLLIGTMPQSICYHRGELLANLQKLSADCAGNISEVVCECCNVCT